MSQADLLAWCLKLLTDSQLDAWNEAAIEVPYGSRLAGLNFVFCDDVDGAVFGARVMTPEDDDFTVLILPDGTVRHTPTIAIGL